MCDPRHGAALCPLRLRGDRPRRAEGRDDLLLRALRRPPGRTRGPRMSRTNKKRPPGGGPFLRLVGGSGLEPLDLAVCRHCSAAELPALMVRPRAGAWGGRIVYGAARIGTSTANAANC